jgi:hypothetical protein
MNQGRLMGGQAATSRRGRDTVILTIEQELIDLCGTRHGGLASDE